MEISGQSMMHTAPESPSSLQASVDVHQELVETDAVARDVEAELRFQGDQVRSNRDRVEAMRAQLRKFQQITADNTKEIKSLRANRFRLIQSGEQSPADREASQAGAALTQAHEADVMRRSFRSRANEVPHMDLEDEDQRSEASADGAVSSQLYPPSDPDSDVDSVVGREGVMETAVLTDEHEDAFLGIKSYVGSIFAPQSISSWSELPADNLALNHVHGFAAHGRSNNVFWLASREVVFTTGSIAVIACIDSVFDESTPPSQRFFTKHKHEIASICVHPDGMLVATGEDAPEPCIYVWDSDAESMGLAGPPLQDLHRRGISALSFSKDGRWLLSAGYDSVNTVLLHDWKSGELLCQDTAGPNRVLSVRCNPHDGTFVTVGSHHIKFWTVAVVLQTEEAAQMSVWQKRLQGKKGIFGRHGTGRSKTLLCADFVGPGVTITGAKDGTLMVWKGAMLTSWLQAHRGPVFSLWSVPGDESALLCSGGKDGTVGLWVFDSNLRTYAPTLTLGEGCLRSLCWHDTMYDTRNVIVAGTAGGKILYVPVREDGTTTCTPIAHGHSSGRIDALAAHPTLPLYVTASSAGVLLLWDAERRCLVSQCIVKRAVSALAFSPDGARLAAGLSHGGGILVMLSDDRKLKPTAYSFATPLREPVSVLKYSPQGDLLASASGHRVEVFNAHALKSRVGVCSGHTGLVTHLDWASDGSVLVTVSRVAYELLFWDRHSLKQRPASSLAELYNPQADIRWASWTSVLGWPVQGIVGRYRDESELMCVDRHAGGAFLVSGDMHGAVGLFRYPCASAGAHGHEHPVHVGPVSQVAFVQLQGAELVVSCGAVDQCVLQWQLVPDTTSSAVGGHKERETAAAPSVDPDLQQVLQWLIGEDPAADSDEDEEEADEFESAKPYLVSVCPPSGAETHEESGTLPKWELALQHVHGVFTNRVRGNIHYLRSGEVVFGVGKMCVVQGFGKVAGDGDHAAVPRKQRFFSQHSGAVHCLACHPNGVLVASAETTTPGRILVWDSEEMEVISQLTNDTRGVSALTFSPDGELLIAISNGNGHRVSIWDWEQEVLLEFQDGDKVDRHQIVSVKVSPASKPGDYTFVTVGVRHVRFWSFQKERMKSRRGVANRTTLPTHLCAEFGDRHICVTGTDDGELWIWRGHELSQTVRAHQGPVFDLTRSDADMYLCSAGKDGMLRVRDLLTLELVETISLMEHALGQDSTDVLISSISEGSCCIRSIDWSVDRILVGTSTCDVFEVLYSDPRARASGEKDRLEVSVLQHAHNSGHIRALCTHPLLQVAATGGEDETVRIWACEDGFVLLGIVDVAATVSALDFSPEDGSTIAVGFMDGDVKFLEYAAIAGRVDANAILVGSHLQRRKQDSVFGLKYSPNGKYLAVGSRGAFIDVYSMMNYELITTCKGHSGSVAELDWDVDSLVLQTNSTNDELMFWEIPSGFQIRRVADVRDTEWASWSLRLGWPVLGSITPGKESSILAVRRQVTKPGSVFAIGDRKGTIKMFNFPNPKKTETYTTYQSNMSSISSLCYTHDDTFLVALGGSDSAILMYKSTRLLDIPVTTADIDLILEKPLSVGTGQEADSTEAGEPMFSLVKPYLGALFAPTTKLYADIPPDVVDSKLKLTYLHGYRGLDCRHNLTFLSTGEFAYIALGIVVIHSPLDSTRSQRLFTKHQGDVICIAAHPDGKVLASADTGTSPTVMVWNSENLKVLSKLNLFQHGTRWLSDPLGVACLAFGGKGGKTLVSVGRFGDNTVAVMDWGQATLIASGSTECSQVLAVACNPKDSTIVTCGVSHLKFWTIRKTRLQASDALFGGVAVSRTMQSIEFIVDKDFNLTLTGSIDGGIFAWKGSRLLRFFEAHVGPVFELLLIPGSSSLLSAGEDGLLKFWLVEEANAKLKEDESNAPISIEPDGNELIVAIPARYNHCIRSLARKDGDILIGTANNEVLHVGLQSQHGRLPRTLITGHGNGSTVAVAQHPKRPAVLFSVGEDSCLKVWDGMRMQLLRLVDLEELVQARPTCMHISKSGETLALGFDNGVVALASVDCTDDTTVSVRVMTPLDACCRSVKRAVSVTCVKFSLEAESQFLAVGAVDGIIDVYSVGEAAFLNHVAACRGHTGSVTQIDWAWDGHCMQSCSSACELMFWEFEHETCGAENTVKAKCKQQRAIACRDVEFPEWTCPLGWPVQDLHHMVPDEKCLSSVHASLASRTCVAGDTSGRVSLFTFPSVDSVKPFQQMRAHPCAVSCVQLGPHSILSGSAVGGGFLQWTVASQHSTAATGNEVSFFRDSCVDAVLRQPRGGETAISSSKSLAAPRAFEDPDDKFFDSFHSYVAAIKDPPGWKPQNNGASAPDNELRLEYVLGYSGIDHHANIIVAHSHELLYHTAKLCIIADWTNDRRTQRIFDQHEREVSCMALHPKGTLVASVDEGDRPSVLIWNSLSLRLVCKIKLPTTEPVPCVCFGADGRIFAAVSRGSSARLSFTDWANELLLAESQPENSAIVGFQCNPITGTFVTCGINHMAFWRLQGRNLSRQAGVVTGKEALTCIAFSGSSEQDSLIITGSESGRMYLWTEDAESLVSRTPHAMVDAHIGPIFDVFADKEGVVSADKGGHIQTWKTGKRSLVKDVALSVDESFSKQECFHCRKSVCVRAICRIRHSDDTSMLILGMGNNSICGLSLNDGSLELRILNHGHGHGKITAVASHPGKPLFATAAEDRMVYLWSREQRTALHAKKFDHEPSALTFSPDGSWVAVGFLNGTFILLRLKQLEAITPPEKCRMPRKAVTTIRYSPDGRFLAVGSADSAVFVYSVKMELHEDEREMLLQLHGVCRGLTGSVLNVDWSVDSSQIQSESDAYDTMVWDVLGSRSEHAIAVRNAQEHSSIEWATRTCILTWHASGLVHPGADLSSIRSASRSNLGDVLSVGDSDGHVRLLRFPCVDRGGGCRTYFGHKQSVAQVSFSYDDRHLISVGSRDQAVLIWQHLVIPGAEGTDAVVKSLLSIEQASARIQRKDQDTQSGFDDIFPFVSNLFPPSSWGRGAPLSTDPPPGVMTMQYVHGFKGISSHGNMFALSTGEVLYLAAAVVVVFDVEKGKQRHFSEHSHEVISVAQHPREDIVASTDAGPDGTVLIWNATSFAVLYKAKGIHRSVTTCLCFSVDGSKLITANCDQDNTICLYEWRTKKRLAVERSGHHQVVAVSCHPGGESIVSCGVKHVQFWTERRGHLSGKLGSFGDGRPQTMLAIGFTREEDEECYTITAAQNGCVYLWKDTMVHRIVVAHRGPVLDMVVTMDGILTGGSDGLVKLWDADWTCCVRLDVAELTHGMSGHASGKEFRVCSVAASVEHEAASRRVLVGLQSNELFEFCFEGDPQELEVLPSTRLVVQAHASTSLRAVAAHPVRQEFATVGNDKMLRTWTCDGCCGLAARALDSQPSALSYSANGKQILVGLELGMVVSTNDTCSHDFSPLVHRRKVSVSCLRPSPSGRFLAIGYSSGHVDVYDTLESSVLCTCKGARGAIEHVDWSASEEMLQCNSSALELLFFKVDTGHAVSRAAEFRDQVFSAWTCTFGWMVKGLSQLAPELVVAVQGGPALMAVGLQSGEIVLTRFPCISGIDHLPACRGHLGLVSAAFTANGKHVVSIGVDCSIVQWQIEEVEPTTPKIATEAMSDLGHAADGDVNGSVILLFKKKIEFGAGDFKSKCIGTIASMLKVKHDKVSSESINGDDLAIKLHVAGLPTKEVLAILDTEFQNPQGRLRKELAVSCIIANDEVYRLVRKPPCREDVRPLPTVDANELYSDPALLKPYISSLFHPSGFVTDPDSQEPEEALELEHVYGFSGINAIGSVFYLRSHDVLFAAATIAVVQERSQDARQHMYRAHEHEIVATALHPGKEIVATGDCGPQHQVQVWNSSTMELLSQFSASARIRCFCFSREGSKLAVVIEASDAVHLEVFDWKARSKLVSERADRSAVLSIKHNPFDERKEDCFFTCGVSHLKVWSLTGTLLNARAWTGEVNTKARLQPFLSIAIPRKAMLIAGAQSGDLYIFRINPAGPKLEGVVLAHDGPVYDLWASETLVLSCGHDGLVHRWSIDHDVRPAKAKSPFLTKLKSSAIAGRVSLRSVCLRETAAQTTVLVASSTNEVHEIDEETNRWTLVTQGHSAGAIRTLCTDPSSPDRLLTGGDDGTLRMWDCATFQCRHSRAVGHPILSSHFTSDGQVIAVGVQNGSLLLLHGDLSESGHVQLPSKVSSPIVAVRFDVKAQYLAVARQNNTLEILNFQGKCERFAVFKGIASAIVNIDWDVESRVLRTATTGLELLFWDLKSNARVHKIDELRDRQWASHNCTLGWYCQGPLSMVQHENCVTSIDCSSGCQILAVGESGGAVRLYRFPSCTSPAKSKAFLGHLPGVACVRFDADSGRLFTSGGADMCVFQWRVVKTTWDPVVKSLVDKGIPLMPQPSPSRALSPSAAPTNEVVLEHVHGFRGHDTCGTLKALLSGDIVYNAATMGVVHDPRTNHQNFFRMHEHDVISVALHPSSTIVATGDCGASPVVYVWDSETMKSLARIDGANCGLRGPITALCFSPDGRQLVVITSSENHELFVVSWETKSKDFSASSGHTRVFACEYQPSGALFVTCGIDHVTFWIDKGGRPVKRKALFGKHWKLKTMLCCSFCAVDFIQQANKKELAITGGIDGHLYVFGVFAGSDWRPELLNNAFEAHQGSVFDICDLRASCSDQVLTSGRDGFVRQLKIATIIDSKDKSRTILKLERMREWDLSVVFANTTGVAVGVLSGECFAKSICRRDQDLVVGTHSNEVCQTSLARSTGGTLLVCGHQSGRINGVCCNPTKPHFVTVGDDCQLKLWSTHSRSSLEAKPLDSPGTAVDLSNDGRFAAVGLQNGMVLIVKVYDEPQEHGSHLESITELEPQRTCRITSVRFSTEHGATYLAIGCADSAIHIYQHLPNNEFSCLDTAKPESGSGHKGAIVSLNWSATANCLQSTCDQGVVVVWYWGGATNPVLRVDQTPDAVRENVWADWTSTVGWPVHGLSSMSDAGEQLRAVARSRSKQHKAVAGSLDSSGSLMLTPFPFADPSYEACRRLQAHSRDPVGLAFAAEDSHILTVGGPDLAVLQWRHSHQPRPASPSILQLVALQPPARRVKPKLKPPAIPYKAPTAWPSKPTTQDSEPEHMLTFEHAYGYRGHDAGGGVQFMRSADDVRQDRWKGEFLYFAAGRAVVHDSRLNSQRILGEQIASIVCQAVSADGIRIATGGGRESPCLFIWRARDGLVLKKLHGHHDEGFAAVCFSVSDESSKVFCVGSDPRHQVAIYDWMQRSNNPKPMAICAGGPDPILGVRCRSFAKKDQFVTFGVKHLRFWRLVDEDGTPRLLSDRAAFQEHRTDHTFLCVAFHEAFTIAGTAEGVLFVLNHTIVTRVIDADRGHALAVMDLDFLSGVLVSGSLDGNIKLWQFEMGDLKLKQTLQQRQVEAGARGISESRSRAGDETSSSVLQGCAHLSKCTRETAKFGVTCCKIARVTSESGTETEILLLIGTTANEIFLASGVAREDLAGYGESGYMTTMLSQGHFGSVLAVAPHPSKAMFATGGQDGTVRVYDADDRILLAMGYYTDGEVHSVDWAPRENVDRHAIAAGVTNGRVCVFTYTAGKVSLEVTHVIKSSDPTRGAVSCVRFSPDSQQLAAGTRCGHIDVYDALSGYQWGGVCAPRADGTQDPQEICSIDWSEDSQTLQSLDLGGRHALWDMVGKPNIPQKSLQTGRDEVWSTYTVLAGWAVEGVVQGHKHGNPGTIDCVSDARGVDGVRIVKGVPKSPCLSIVTAESGWLRLQRFPARGDPKQPGYKAFHNGTKAVVGARFSYDGSRLFSVSGDDMCVIQWTVVHQDEVGESGQVIRANRAADGKFSLSDRENFWKISNADLEALRQRNISMDLNLIEPQTESLKKMKMHVIDFTFDKVHLEILGREGKEAPLDGTKNPILPVSSMVTWKELLLLLETFFGVKERSGQPQRFTFMYEKFYISNQRQEICEQRMRELFPPPKYQDADIAGLKHRTRRAYTVRNEQDFRQCWHWVEQEYRWLLKHPNSKLPDGQAFTLPVYAIPFATKRMVAAAGDAAKEGTEAAEELSDRDSDVETLVSFGGVLEDDKEEHGRTESSKAKTRRLSQETIDPQVLVGPTEIEGVPPEVAAPNVTFELECAHGYNGRGSHRNLFFLKTGEVLYPAGCLGVRFDRHGNQQKIFGRHKGVITAMALHHDGETVATGEQGQQPMICVWNTFTNTQIHRFVGEHKHKVSALAFSTSTATADNYLIAIGGKDPQTVSVYDWKNGKHELTQEAPSEKIVAVVCNPHYPDLRFVSVGVRHVKFWERQRTRLDVSKGSYQIQTESKTMLSVAFTETRDLTLTGSKDGHVFVWKHYKAIWKVDCLRGPIFDIIVQADNILVGGKDDVRPIQMLKTGKSWPDNPSLQKVSSVLNDGLTLDQGQAKTCVRAIAWRANEIVAGTSANCLHWVGTKPGPSSEVPVKTMVRSHVRGRICALAVHPTKPVFVSVGEDGFVRVYDLEQRAPVQYRNVGEPLTAVAVSPKEPRIAVGLRNGELRIISDLDLKDVTSLGNEYKTKRCEVHTTHRKHAVNALRYHPQGDLLALAAEDKIIDIYNVVDNYRHVRCIEASPGGHLGPVTGIDFGELDGTLFLQSCSGTTEIKHWQLVRDGENVHGQLVGAQRARDADWLTWTLPIGWSVKGVHQSVGSSSVVTRSPPIIPRSRQDDDEPLKYIVAAGGRDGRVSVLTYPCVSTETRFRSSAAGHAGAVAEAQFTPRGHRVITIGAADQNVLVWKVTQRERGADLPGDDGGQESTEKAKARNLCSLVTLSPAVDRIAAVLSDVKITVWSLLDGQTKTASSVTGQDWHTITACSFNSTGTIVCSASADKTVRVSEVVEGGRTAAPDQTWKLEGHEDEVTSCAFSLDGKRIVSGSMDRTVRVWDSSSVAQEKCLGIGKGHRKEVLCVAWSDDGRRVCSGSMDNNLLVYEVKSNLDVMGGKQLLEVTARMRGHKQMVVCCAFSPGPISSLQVWLCSGSLDKSVMVWDVESGSLLHKLEHTEKLLGCAFSMCSHFVGAICLDNSVTLWDVSGDNAEQVEQHISTASSAVNVMGGAFTEKGDLMVLICRDPDRASVETTLFLPPPQRKRN